MNSNPTDLTAALEKSERLARDMTTWRDERFAFKISHNLAEECGQAIRTLTQALRAGASPPPVAGPASGEIADGDQTAELCALIFDNVKASVDHIGDDAIAVLSDVTAAAEAILAAGFRRQASDSASPGGDSPVVTEAVREKVARIVEPELDHFLENAIFAKNRAAASIAYGKTDEILAALSQENQPC